MMCAIAKNLEEGQVSEIEALEQQTGLTLVAFSCRSLDPEREERLRKIEAELGSPLQTEAAAISEEQLGQIRGLEGEMGLSLVAVQV
jgi:hypothetical protein